MTLIAYITFIAAGLFDLMAMLLLDTGALQACDFNNREYSKSLKDNGEYTSPKRLLVLAVLLGFCTTMSQMSWIVVMILAAALLAQWATILANKRKKNPVTAKRAKRLHIIVTVLAIILTGAVAGILGHHRGEADACRGAAMMVMMILVFSPLLAMAVNAIIPARK